MLPALGRSTLLPRGFARAEFEHRFERFTCLEPNRPLNLPSSQHANSEKQASADPKVGVSISGRA